MTSFSPLTAAATTELAVAGPTQYLAVWRLAVSISAAPDSAWQRICRVSAPGPACLYVPAFSLMRSVVQRLGVGLTEAQPALELHPGLERRPNQSPVLAEVGPLIEVGNNDAPGRDGAPGATVADGPGFGTVSPVLVGRQDAGTLGHFVFLAVESHEARDLHSVEYQLETTGEELLFIPAVWDPRYIHESNWRLLLREFDGLVA